MTASPRAYPGFFLVGGGVFFADFTKTHQKFFLYTFCYYLQIRYFLLLFVNYMEYIQEVKFVES